MAVNSDDHPFAPLVSNFTPDKQVKSPPKESCGQEEIKNSHVGFLEFATSDFSPPQGKSVAYDLTTTISSAPKLSLPETCGGMVFFTSARSEPAFNAAAAHA